MSLGNVSNFSAREYVMSAGATMSAKCKRILSEEDCIEIGKRTNVFQQTHFWLKHMTPFNLKPNNQWNLTSSFEIDHRFTKWLTRENSFVVAATQLNNPWNFRFES
jgi:hypothetical protein